MMAAHAMLTMKGSPSATCANSIAACAAGAAMASYTAADASTPATACDGRRGEGGRGEVRVWWWWWWRVCGMT